MTGAVFAMTKVLTASERRLTPFQAIRECKDKMPRFSDILPISQFKENDTAAKSIVKDIKSLVVTANLQVQFGTFYFYNKAGTPMGETIVADESVDIVLKDRYICDIGDKLRENDLITGNLDSDDKWEIKRMKTGNSIPFVLEGKGYIFTKGEDNLEITRKSRNVLHIPEKFQDIKNSIVVCDIQDVPMKIWEENGATHGKFESANGMVAMEMFYQSGYSSVRVAMDNGFHLPVSRKAGQDEDGMLTFTHDRKKDAAFGLASIFWGILVGCPFADFSNPGYKDYRSLLWQ